MPKSSYSHCTKCHKFHDLSASCGPYFFTIVIHPLDSDDITWKQVYENSERQTYARDAEDAAIIAAEYWDDDRILGNSNNYLYVLVRAAVENHYTLYVVTGEVVLEHYARKTERKILIHQEDEPVDLEAIAIKGENI